MAQYKVTVFTGSIAQAGTMNKLYIKLVGAEGESDHRWLANLKGGFYQGAVSQHSRKSLFKQCVNIHQTTCPLPYKYYEV